MDKGSNCTFLVKNHFIAAVVPLVSTEQVTRQVSPDATVAAILPDFNLQASKAIALLKFYFWNYGCFLFISIMARTGRVTMTQVCCVVIAVVCFAGTGKTAVKCGVNVKLGKSKCGSVLVNFLCQKTCLFMYDCDYQELLTCVDLKLHACLFVCMFLFIFHLAVADVCEVIIFMILQSSYCGNIQE
jgi:hypothetical protein